MRLTRLHVPRRSDAAASIAPASAPVMAPPLGDSAELTGSDATRDPAFNGNHSSNEEVGYALKLNGHAPSVSSTYVGARHPILPRRATLEFANEERALLVRIAKETFQGLATAGKLGPQDARERYETWINSRDWAGVERDPLTPFAISAVSSEWRLELEEVAAALGGKVGAVPRLDVDRFAHKGALREDVSRLLQVTACVPIFATREGVSIVIGSVNPVAAAIVGQHISETLPEPPFTSAMRLRWDFWVGRLEEYGF